MYLLRLSSSIEYPVAATCESTYQGDLRTSSTHLRSGTGLITDAPPDNQGKGESYSPTDLVAVSLLNCMITVIGIYAKRNDLNLGKLTGSVEKVMENSPRRIAELNVEMVFFGSVLTESNRQILERIAFNCPVAKSLHPGIRQNVTFSYR